MRSQLLFCGVITAALVTGSAVNSADLKQWVKVPPAVWSWTGGYIGGHVGGGYGRTSFSDPNGQSLYGDVVNTPVFLAGAQIGYNWQSERWVFGVELDASRAVSDGKNTCLAASSSVISANCSAGPNVFATGTGRVGYAFGPHGKTLVYLKGGWPGSTIAALSPATANSLGALTHFWRHRIPPISTMVVSVAQSA
nr:outer membrane beta-barrel protein [Bradyrhizobium yuanmingense]